MKLMTGNTFAGLALMCATQLLAGNPILKDSDPGFLYAADPAAEVFNGKVYVYCSHDQPDATSYSPMQDYMILESSDMTNWVNHGVVLEPRTAAGFEYATGQMNAPDAAYKDGWYYWYFPYDKTYVGVAKSLNPTGPWESAITSIQAPIATIFDPTVFVDDDGQAYIYGNDHKVNIGDAGAHIMGAKLKDNMIELDGDWFRLSEEEVNEAVHIFKRNGIYYFTARKDAETDYWMADNPLPYPGNPGNSVPPVYSDPSGYASYKGQLAASAPDAPNHASAIEFNGKWWFFYQRGDVNSGSNYRRSACVDEMHFNPDGTIQQIVYTLDESEPPQDPRGVGSMSQEAEDFSETNGVVVESCADIGGGSQLGFIQNSDWSAYTNIYFGNDTHSAIPFYFRVSCDTDGGDIELHLDSAEGDLIGTATVANTGGWLSYETITGSVVGVSGTHDLYLVYRGGSGYLLNLNWFEWTPANVSTQQSSLIAEWTFDNQTLENIGTSGSVHDGTFINSNGDDLYSADTRNGAGWSLKIDSIADGYSNTTGGELLKIGNSKSTDVGYASTFDVPAFTFSIWAKTDGDWSKWDEYYSKGTEGAGGWVLRARDYTQGDGLWFQSYTTGNAIDYAPYDVDMEDRQWHLVTTTFDGTNMNLYLDDVLVATNSDAVTMTDTAPYALAFGAREDGSRGEDILIDNIQFYDRALSAQEVGILFTGDLSAHVPEFMPGITTSNGNFSAWFTGTTGLHYRLEYIDDLTGSNNWQVVTNILSLAASPADVSVPMTNNTGFYRMLWVP